MLRQRQGQLLSCLAQLWRGSAAGPGGAAAGLLAQHAAAASSSSGIATLSAARQAMAAAGSRWFSAMPELAGSGPPRDFVTLNTLQDNPGATKQFKRVGRGIGSGLGKTAGRGHKGQKARTGRKPKLGFEGGQTPLRLRVPRRGFHNPHTRWYRPLNLDVLQSWVEQGRLDTSQVITMKELRETNAVGHQLGWGVKLLGNGAEQFKTPLHIQVSKVSDVARAAIEKAGGSVTTVYYNQLGLRALLRPEWFPKKGRLLPRPARPPPKLVGQFERTGELPPNREVPQPAAAAAEGTE